ncbi:MULTISPECIES: IS66 family insertion sequence element accessory protein TnpA [unclassified Endozoicomonas]
MHQKISNRRTSAQWQNLIDQQQESGVNQKGFCELNNICLHCTRQFS